ncbi:MAG: hypothetical protein ACTSUX_02830 [Promethearchaeota archaeon]
MKTRDRKMVLYHVILILIFNFVLISTFANGFTEPIQPPFGTMPTIDGEIDENGKEWDDALKMRIFLYQNLSAPENGLPIDLWIKQNDAKLFFAIQFELEQHSSSEFDYEFIGILISESESNKTEDFTDFRVIQFTNISTGQYNYRDYHINNFLYVLDVNQSGEGAAKLKGDIITYEFSINLDNYEDYPEDVFLDYLNSYAFKIIFGKINQYPAGFLLSNIIVIKIQYPPLNPPIVLTELLFIIFDILIFGLICVLFLVYVYKISKLKLKIKRFKV